MRGNVSAPRCTATPVDSSAASISLTGSSIEQSKGTYYWARMDQVTAWARERGLRILANVSYTPAWARPTSCRDMICPPADLNDYADFMGKLVAHYSPLGVKHFEVWNEPNQHFWWKPQPEPGPLRRDAPQGVREGATRRTRT